MTVPELIEDLKHETVSEASCMAVDAILRLLGSEVRYCKWCNRPIAPRNERQIFCIRPATCHDDFWNKKGRPE